MSLSAVPNGSAGAAYAEPAPANELAERLSDPQVAAAIGTLLDRLDVIVLLVETLDGFLRHSETVLDSAVASASDLRATVDGAPGIQDIDVAETISALAAIAAALPGMTPALIRGAESGAIDELTSPGLVGVLHLVSAGAQDALADPAPIEVHGALSLMRVLKDPDIARAIGFFATLGRSLGRQLATGAAPAAPSASNPE